jgi:hypothetical protein
VPKVVGSATAWHSVCLFAQSELEGCVILLKACAICKVTRGVALTVGLLEGGGILLAKQYTTHVPTWHMCAGIVENCFAQCVPEGCVRLLAQCVHKVVDC